MITEKNATAENNSGLGVNRFNLVMTPEVFKVFYSSLYEDKETAVLRELVSNGDDGHTAAGLKNTPVIVHLPTKLVPELVIVDQGIGMSLEDVQTTYTTYGRSTKRDSNDEIGGFGYGAKSPFAISQSFTVETTKNGITTLFVNFIDEDGPNYTIISSTETGNPSGTTVKVPVADEQMQSRLAQKATEGLFALWETQPEIKNAGTRTPVKYTVINRKSDHLEVAGTQYTQGLLTSVSSGPFMYKIPVNMMERLRATDDHKFITKVYEMTYDGGYNSVNTRVVVVPKFAVGELELSPSRERIEDTKDNEARIIAKIAKIREGLTIDPLPLEQHVKKANQIVSKYGVKVSDLVGPISNDYVMTFNNPDDVIKDILPAGWEPTAVNVAAVALQSQLDQTTYSDKSQLPAYVESSLVTANNVGTVRVILRGPIEYHNYLYSLHGILRSLSAEKMNTDTVVSRIVIRELGLQRRSGRSYYTARDFVDGQTIIMVRPKAKAMVSRCLNNVATGWNNVSMLFTDDIPSNLATLQKTATTLGFTFNYVVEDEIRKLNKTIPKTVRTTTTTVKTKVDRRVARLYVSCTSDHRDVRESEIASFLVLNKTLFFVLEEGNRVDYLLDTRIKEIMALQKVQVMFVSKTDYLNKKYISDVFEGQIGNPNFTKYESASHWVSDKVVAYIATLPNGKELLEESVAVTVLDQVSYTAMYPTARIKHVNSYCSSTGYFASYLANIAKAPLDIRCKWSGYANFNDVKTLTDVMNIKDIAFIKKTMAAFAQHQLKY